MSTSGKGTANLSGALELTSGFKCSSCCPVALVFVQCYVNHCLSSCTFFCPLLFLYFDLRLLLLVRERFQKRRVFSEFNGPTYLTTDILQNDQVYIILSFKPCRRIFLWCIFLLELLKVKFRRFFKLQLQLQKGCKNIKQSKQLTYKS